MTDRSFKPDLTGSDETLDALLERLRTFSKRRPAPSGRDLPPDYDFVTSRRPRGGAGGAEAPVPKDVPLPDLYASI